MKSFHRRSHRSAPALSEPPPRPAALRPAGGAGRLDQVLVEQGLASSRAQAQTLIRDGRVELDGAPATKPSQKVLPYQRLSVCAGEHNRYVSRGGIKLAGALMRCRRWLAHGAPTEPDTATPPDLRGRVCLDVGQSTGGFTDCLLQHGAARVVGVEVGHGQLHPRLRSHPSVVCLEDCNARTLDAARLGAYFPSGGFELIVCDASFISLRLLLPRWPALLAPRGCVLALVKPQFELGPQALGKGGIVRADADLEGLQRQICSLCADAGLAVHAYFDSSITGGDGNRECFVCAGLATAVG